MTIQKIDLTVPGGDTPRTANTKINANFTAADNAASKLVGTADGQIPLAQDILKAAYSNATYYRQGTSPDVNSFTAGNRSLISKDSAVNYPPTLDALMLIETQTLYGGSLQQIAYGYRSSGVFRRCYEGGSWSDWSSISTNTLTYNTTTAAGANVVVDSTGKLMRSTSSEVYKDILAPLELDTETYTKAISLAPIVYRSTAEADNPLHHYYSFSAEALGAFDPAFTLWRYTETVVVTKVDEEGNEYTESEEVALAEPQAEGLNINAILAFGHSISIKQNAMIEAQAVSIKNLETRLLALEAK